MSRWGHRTAKRIDGRWMQSAWQGSEVGEDRLSGVVSIHILNPRIQNWMKNAGVIISSWWFQTFFLFSSPKSGEDKQNLDYIYIIFLIGLVQPSTRIRWFIRVFHHFLRKIFGKRHAGRSGPRTTRSWPRNVADAGETNERRGGFAWQVYGGVHSIYLVGGDSNNANVCWFEKKNPQKNTKKVHGLGWCDRMTPVYLN